jgi:hypothetical protein
MRWLYFGLGDGGKWMCGISEISLKPPGECIMYSFGISNDASFEEEILQTTNCTIYAFDPSIGGLPRPSFVNEFRWDELQKSRIFFYKYALAETSGSSSTHSLTANLFDLMHQHQHNYIDILKIDIEGAEWNLLKKIFAYLTTSDLQGKLPVGQILIEFHYKSMLLTKQVIEGLNAFGFQAFSREINLQPCINGGKPVAAEYAFINAKQFLDRMQFKTLDQNHYPIPAAVTPIWHVPATGLIYLLTQQSRFQILKFTLAELYHKLWRWYPRYPIVIFHDDLDEAHQQALQAALLAMPLTFHRINFTLPSHLDPSFIPNRTECAPASSTIGYRFMCRFHATQVHQILDSMSQYASIDYILRVDDDSLFTKPIGYDLFHYMKINHKLYGFVNILGDDRRCVRGLWNATRSFLASPTARRISGYALGYNRNASFFEEWNEPNVFYNNFEISHLSIWKNPLWKAYMHEIDASGGIFYHRWGDAPIHSIGVSLMLSKDQVHSFSDIGYRHFPFVDQSARGLPMPNSDPFIPIHAQDCKFYSHWSCSSTNNGSQWNHTQIVYPSVTQGQAVLYTFSRQGREYSLAETISNLYEEYLTRYPRPIVIFYSREQPINNALFFRKLIKQSALINQIHFHGVDLKNSSIHIHPKDQACGSTSIHDRAVSYFLRQDVFKILNGYYGYEWFFRFGDSSMLHKAIDFDLFDYLVDQKKHYAFVNSIREFSKCVGNLWHSALTYSSRNSLAAGSRAYFEQWPRHVVFYTNFEISHISLWNSSVCQGYLRMIEKEEEDELGYPRYGDAALHTMCVLLSLTAEEVHYLEEVDYSVRIPPLNSSSAIISPPEAAVAATEDLIISLEEIDQRFYPRRFGWLGGDVCTSIALPAAPIDPSVTASPVVDYVWLFGDSLIGTSTDRKRSEGVLISNSVAIVQLNNTHTTNSSIRSIDTIRMFWRSDDQGSPLPIFQQVAHQLSNASSELLFWPLGGIAIQQLSQQNTKLIILGHFVQSYAPRTADGEDLRVKASHIIQSLAFHELACSLIVVTNPHDNPESWRYEFYNFPSSESADGSYKWFAAADASGRAYASDEKDRMVYLLGSYSPENTTALEAAIHRKHAKGYFDPYQISLHESYQVLSRITAAALSKGDLHQLEVLCASSAWRLIALGCQPQRLFSPRITEASFLYDLSRNRWLIVSLQVGETAVQLCQSAQVEGPWQCQRVMQVPSASNHSSRVITYGAKVHPELLLDSKDEMVVSLISNAADDFLSLFDDGNRLIYTPKFFRLRKPQPTA